MFMCAGTVARINANQGARTTEGIQIGSTDIGGVVTSTRGPEAGVWVIAQTSELPAPYIKIVVTDDQGRYVLPELPAATYRVWVRGYGLVDSTPIQAAPGRLINLKAVIAPTPKDAAKYYPADYWYSLIQVPDKAEFPMKPTPPPTYAADAQSAGPATSGPSGDEEFTAQRSSGMENQQQWIDTMKRGCQSCHQIGDSATRYITHLAKYHVTSSEQAWATRLHFSQKGSQMMRVLARYVDQDRAIKMFADWTDRIAAGEVPPAPPRPQGIERNVVITMWDWGKFQSLVHDE